MSIQCDICKKGGGNINEYIVLTNGVMLHTSCFNGLRVKVDEITERLTKFDRERLSSLELELKKTDDNILDVKEKIELHNKKLSSLFGFLRDDNLDQTLRWREEKRKDLYEKFQSVKSSINQTNDSQLKYYWEYVKKYLDYWFDYPPDWNDRRKQAIEKANGKCKKCRSKSNLQVHHVIALGRGGSNKLENLKVLCVKCHEKEHNTTFKEGGNVEIAQTTKNKVSTINEAILQDKELEIIYSKYEGDITKRKIRPIEIQKGVYNKEYDKSIYTKENLYLKAFCFLRNDERVFRIRSIKKISVIDKVQTLF